jgi:arsenical pump membrane protein
LAYVAPGLTVALALARPRVGARLQVGPATAGLLGLALMLAAGAVDPPAVLQAAATLWRPFIGVASIMLTAAVAEQVGIVERLAAIVERGTRGPVWLAFAIVFVLAAGTATLLNNDSAILLLTPMIVPLVKRRYPLRQHLVVPFSFCVFAAAGVAPLVISNPINFVVASHAGIGFNAYAAVMIPVAVVGWLVAFAMLCLIFRADIRDPIPGRGPTAPPLPRVTRAEWEVLVVMGAVFGTYPIVSLLDGPVWAVAGLGALAGVAVCRLRGVASPLTLGRMVAWDILLFMFAVYVMAQGLRQIGVVALLARGYGAAGGPRTQVAAIGTFSALGSALLNNHPMALLNAVALTELPGADRRHVLAALIGGDLGPRLLPMGSLAGLLWVKTLARIGVPIPLKQFVRVGALVTLPALAVSLLALLLIG